MASASVTYAYDLLGNKHNVTLKDGRSYLDDGNRVPIGWTVQTAGGIFQRWSENAGGKVAAHNVYVANTDNNGKEEGGGGGGTAPWWNNLQINTGDVPAVTADQGMSFGDWLASIMVKIPTVDNAVKDGPIPEGSFGSTKTWETPDASTEALGFIKKYGILIGGVLLVLFIIKGGRK